MWNNLSGKTISFEGGEGSGKSTILKKVIEKLQNEGVDVVSLREPGGNNISEQIREVILNKGNTAICAETECLLFAASRAQLVNENIKPLLKTNKTIFFDRFVDTSYVYQGFVRGLGIDKVKQINDFATNGFLPDLTIIFDIDPEIGFKRISDNNRETNRLDLESLEFHKNVRLGYSEIVKRFPDRIKVVDASKSIDEVFEDVMNLIKNL